MRIPGNRHHRKRYRTPRAGALLQGAVHRSSSLEYSRFDEYAPSKENKQKDKKKYMSPTSTQTCVHACVPCSTLHMHVNSLSSRSSLAHQHRASGGILRGQISNFILDTLYLEAVSLDAPDGNGLVLDGVVASLGRVLRLISRLKDTRATNSTLQT